MNKEERTEYMRAYRANNREKVNQLAREHYHRNRDYYQQYYLDHKEEMKAQSAKNRKSKSTKPKKPYKAPGALRPQHELPQWPPQSYEHLPPYTPPKHMAKLLDTMTNEEHDEFWEAVREAFKNRKTDLNPEIKLENGSNKQGTNERNETEIEGSEYNPTAQPQ